MIVCVCHRVSDREITRQVQAGLGFREIQRTLGVATCCGRCAGAAREVIHQASSGETVAGATLPRMHFVPMGSHG